MDKSSRAERNWVLIWAAAIVLLSSVPYIWGALITPEGYQFLGLTHNIDDGAVYLSWMRQAADGHFFIRNLFTSEPQPARAFNVLFLVMGNFARVIHIPLIWVFHLFRMGLGMLLIWSIWRFSKLFLEDARQRMLLVPLVGLSSGFGWLVSPGALPRSIDLWQPEAITLLSIYLNPLFLVGQLLMLGAFYYLTLASREGRMRDALVAGVCLLFLGNVHSYDVLTVGCVWTIYVVVLAIIGRRLPVRTLLLSLIAALTALPSIGYQLYVYSVDAVYRARANTPAPSPEFWYYLSGYGLILVGAIIGAVLWARSSRGCGSGKVLFPVVWSVVGFLVPFFPIAQQRKLVLGLHIPLCILCAYAFGCLIALNPMARIRYLAAVVIMLMAFSNFRFFADDIRLLGEGLTMPNYVAYLSQDEHDAMNYLDRQAKWNETVLAPPSYALFVPALAGKQVYYGHWSETPGYADKLRMYDALIRPGIPADVRRALFQESGAAYAVFEDWGDGLHAKDAIRGLPVEVVREYGSVIVCHVKGND